MRSILTFLSRLVPMGLLALLAALAPTAMAQDFLPADQAFRVEASGLAVASVSVQYQVASGTYLYRERMQARWTASGAAPVGVPLSLPQGEKKHDPTFDKVMEVYHHDLQATLKLPPGEGTLTLIYQGCADAGLCYPPQEVRYQVRQAGAAVPQLASLGPAAMSLSPPLADPVGAAPASAPPMPMSAPPADEGDQITRALSSGRLIQVIGVFLLAGVLLSLTPCVLPMVPILSSIIVGQGAPVSRSRGFALALAYSQGMALIYTALGVAAGLLGQGLAAYLQHPWVLLGFAVVMVLLALSMFGLYELQLPPALQSWLGAGTSRLPGGRFVSVFVMGAVSALVVSPCVSAPLAGALLYISQTGDVALGASALYAMAWGMSVPLLLVGLSAGSLLPRTGPWMKAVKALFGVLMLAMAVWVVRPAWPFLKAQLTGQSMPTQSHQSALPFQRVRSVAELDAAVALAAKDGRPVMLDFYADWCVACIEMERDTFTDLRVQQRLSGAVLLQADVTANTPDDRALLERFKLFGPPGLIFFDSQGRELSGARVIGFQAPQAFLRSLQNAGL